MEKEVEVKVMTWGSRGWIQVEVIMDEGWNTPLAATIKDNTSRPEEEIEESTTHEEETEESTTHEEEIEESTTHEEETEESTKSEESISPEECETIFGGALPVRMVTPSLKNGSSFLSRRHVEGDQLKCWEKMDSDGDQINAHRKRFKIVGLGNVKNKIIQPRPREKDRIWKEKGRLKKVKMKYETERINEDTNKSTHAMDTITKIAKMEREFVTQSTFKQLFLIGRSYIAELVGNIFSS